MRFCRINETQFVYPLPIHNSLAISVFYESRMYCCNSSWLLLSVNEFNAEKVFTVESDGPAKATVLMVMMTKGVLISLIY